LTLAKRQEVLIVTQAFATSSFHVRQSLRSINAL
jgi:hypothetical protein